MKFTDQHLKTRVITTMLNPMKSAILLSVDPCKHCKLNAKTLLAKDTHSVYSKYNCVYVLETICEVNPRGFYQDFLPEDWAYVLTNIKKNCVHLK